ncbi:MAG: prolyl oligopeptidase family serine peptidase [Pseudomonadota bacterium]
MLFALTLALAAHAEPWQQPPAEILEVLHAPDLPWVWTAPGGAHLLLADGVLYPPLAELAAPMYPLAGVRLDPATHGFWGDQGATAPRLLRVEDGAEIPLGLPEGLQVMEVRWTADGQRFALEVEHPDHLGLWVGSVAGDLREIPGLRLNPMLGAELQWLPDQERLLVKRVPELGEPPAAPLVPPGPTVLEGDGEAPRSTYEARNLLQSAHDEELFVYYATSELAVVEPGRRKVKPLGEPGLYADVDPSPDGSWLLVERVGPPWSHEAAWWRFAHTVEVWTAKGEAAATLASLPLADAVPIHGVPEGMRAVGWRATAPATLVWVEALDGGSPIAEVPHRDRLMALAAPFDAEPREIFRAQHRIQRWRWAPGGGTLMLSQWERERRWRHEWLLDVDAGTARPWFDLSENERYADPGHPQMRPMPNGRWVLRQEGERVWFTGSGATPDGDRPFLDLRPLGEGEAERVWRCDREHYEGFVAFAGEGESQLLVRRESSSEVPNYLLLTPGDATEAPAGEATRAFTERPVTRFEDPAPQLRDIQHRLVTYERADGTPLSFHLYLPPGYQEGQRLPTVLYAYPLEYSDPETAGQVSGSQQRFLRLRGSSHLFFLLRGYAVLDQTAMPVLGDPETAYDSFVEQLVADAEAAVAKAVDLGVTDPDRVGITGHSHGALMTATLLAHSDLFRAGIARSGAYNHTIRPFGFQHERRTLWEASETYLHLSPVMFAPEIHEPLLLIHGAIDENPGTIPFQSDRLFDAVRGSGGTVRLLMLPFEGHGYRANESVEHVLAEQLAWFDRYVRDAEAR